MSALTARHFPHGSLIPLREDVDLLVLDWLATMRASLVFRRQLAAAIGAHELGTRFRESSRLGTFGCGDIKDLQAQGGWADPKTIFKHYRLLDEERHLDGFEKTFGVKAKPDLADLEDPAFR